MELLLLSNSTAPGRGYLEHARDALAEYLADARRLVFVPFALTDYDAYTATVARALDGLGVEVAGAHTDDDAIDHADAIFVGGGNTFRLLKTLATSGLLGRIADRVRDGDARYIGSSAGTNISAPTARTTNDMPIVEPPSLAALNLVPFQINPHYLDPQPNSTHMGETRQERIEQFLEDNDVPVLGLREGTWLRRSGDRLILAGQDVGARLFTRGTEPVEYARGADLSALLTVRARFDH